MAITVLPRENGTAVVSVALEDQDGTALTINDVTSPCWQLMNTDGTVVNNRSFANCALTALEWELTGNDLAVSDVSDRKRLIAFKCVYSSTIGGVEKTGLVLIDEESFTIKELKSRPAT